MNIDQYVDYVDRFLTITSRVPFYKAYHVDKNILSERPKEVTGIVVAKNDVFRFYSPGYTKLNFEVLHEPKDVSWKYCMNWIKTKNLFLDHVMNNVLTLQRVFWETQDSATLVPMSLNKFIEMYSFPYLDVSRLSRLVNNTLISFNGEKYLLRDLFPSSKKVHALILRQVVRQSDYGMKDREIQAILKCNYNIDVSVRTICNYRNSVHIPTYNLDRLSNPYSGYFSSHILLNKKLLRLVPEIPGVYEISLGRDIKYQKSTSRIIYFGRSRNLRKRIQSYLYTSIKNPVIEQYRGKGKLFIRYLVTSKYAQVEHELLNLFIDISGAPPMANRLINRKITIDGKDGLT